MISTTLSPLVEKLSNFLSAHPAAPVLVALDGRCGSGKTTLLNLIGTLDKPTKGKIFLEGKDISILPDKSLSELRRRRIGFVFQAFNLLNEYSVWDNVCLSFYLDGAKPDS